jgi:hypothetical protein
LSGISPMNVVIEVTMFMNLYECCLWGKCCSCPRKLGLMYNIVFPLCTSSYRAYIKYKETSLHACNIHFKCFKNCSWLMSSLNVVYYCKKHLVLPCDQINTYCYHGVKSLSCRKWDGYGTGLYALNDEPNIPAVLNKPNTVQSCLKETWLFLYSWFRKQIQC